MQGMSHLGAVLIITLGAGDTPGGPGSDADEAPLFTAFATLLTLRPLCWLVARNGDEVSRWVALFQAVVDRVAPRLAAHLASLDVAPSLYLPGWLLT